MTLDGFLDEVWPDGQASTFYASNVGRDPNGPDHFLNLLLRPVAEGPRAMDWSIGGMTLGLSVYRKQGQLRVSRVELTPHVKPRDFEVRIVAPVLWDNPERFMERTDFDKLGVLPFHRAHAHTRLEEWRRYLKWKEDIIYEKQVSIPFETWRWENSEHSVVAFLVHKRDRPAGRVEGLSLGVTEDDGDEDDDENDDRDDGSRRRRKRPPRVTDLGEVEWAGLLDRHKPWDVNWGDVVVDRGHGKICIRLDEETIEELRRGGLPERGRLVSSIAGDLGPIRNQQGGVERMKRSQGFSPRLADFIFSSQSASVPSEIPVLEALPGAGTLNPGQSAAVAKALAAPDLCLVQGPPGTGKTTVIAEICLRAAKKGQRVLVASQTNLAVDNALARLAEVPWVRPLRLGRPDRVDEEFKVFLADNVVDRWFGSIADQCRVRLRAGRQAEDELSRLEEALREMQASLRQFEEANRRTVQSAADAQQHQEAQQQYSELAAARQNRVHELRSEVNRLDGVIRWSVGEGPLPSEARLRTFRGHSLAYLENQRARQDALEGVVSALNPAATGGATDTAAAAEIRGLRAEKSTLVDSDELADMQRLRMVNKRLKKLSGDGWNSTTTKLHRAARGAWPADLPWDIQQVVDALRPDAEVRAAMLRARELADQELAVGVEAARAISQSTAHWRTLIATEQQALVDAERELLSAEENRDRALADREAASARHREALEEVQAAKRRWDEAFRWIWESVEPYPPSLEGYDASAQRLEQLQEERGPQVLRATRWRQVQEEWADRLARAFSARQN